MQISYSSFDKYSTCPKMWYFHYISKLRPKYTTSALFFGGAVGQIWQAIALSKKDELTPEEETEFALANSPVKSFNQLIAKIDLNGEEITPTDHRVYYYKGDYDEELLTDEDWAELDAAGHKHGQVLPDGKYISWDDLIIRYPHDLDQDEMVYMNTHFYLSLKRKGAMLIESFQNDILPNIVKVHSIEKPIKIDMSMENDEPLTDFLIGYCDMICDYRITDPKLCEKLGVEVGTVKKILFDNKTASTRYGTKALQEKPQLHIYDYAEQVGMVGYIVGIKKIKRPKRGDRKGETFADIQVQIGYGDEELGENILDSIDEMLYNISEGNFPMKENRKECGRIFGFPCPYSKLCFEGDDSNLFKKPSE